MLVANDLGPVEPCGICGAAFTIGADESVVGLVLTDEGYDGGWSCPECIGYFGSRNPKRFPTWQEYQDARMRYQGPIFQSALESRRAEEKGTYYEALDTLCIPRQR